MTERSKLASMSLRDLTLTMLTMASVKASHGVAFFRFNLSNGHESVEATCWTYCPNHLSRCLTTSKMVLPMAIRLEASPFDPPILSIGLTAPEKLIAVPILPYCSWDILLSTHKYRHFTTPTFQKGKKESMKKGDGGTFEWTLTSLPPFPTRM